MKRLFSAPSFVAAATLASGAVFAGANAALASEPLRVSKAQVNAVTASTSTMQSVQSINTAGTSTMQSVQSININEGGVAVTRMTVTTIKDGKTTVEEKVMKGIAGAERPLTNGVSDMLKDIASWGLDIEDLRRSDP